MTELSFEPHLHTDPEATKVRLAAMKTYMSREVLRGDRFVCATAAACMASIREGDRFVEGQLSHVGRHFDLQLGDRPLRIVVVGQEYGMKNSDGVWGERPHTTMADRYSAILQHSGLGNRYYTEPGHIGRNPHMRGTTSALRIILGKGLGSDHAGEFVTTTEGDTFHVFDAFALVNVLLCSAGPKTTSEGRSTLTMRRNCLRHFVSSLRILQPTLVILQGVAVAKWTRSLFDAKATDADGRLMECLFEDRRLLVCSFSHPSAHGSLRWGDSLRSPYLRETVEPTLRLAVAKLSSR